ncbi:hypothetical protein VFSR5_2685 [Aliivibrio fischeri SR5]|uniref:Restriction endonuclease n=2 Tax=Aliivibrio fischeri TaxID=668 RepID=A0AAV3EMA2_ALIFS|nr:hypothetical protein VFSR5_2685 [Aliivibrio fischeri SR5]
MLPKNKMPEAEVTLRLAISLIEKGKVIGDVVTAIDGAQVKTGNTIHFPIREFLDSSGWFKLGERDRWQGKYQKIGHSNHLIIHSNSGEGDLVATLINGHRLRVESKKGPLVKSTGSKEYPLIREAIGQLMTIAVAKESDILAVAVPLSPKFTDLAAQWRERPLMKLSKIHIVTVGRDGELQGLESQGI